MPAAAATIAAQNRRRLSLYGRPGIRPPFSGVAERGRAHLDTRLFLIMDSPR